jgi:Tfp pilus assembly protein PilW
MKLIMNIKNNQRGQNLMELVVGVGLLTIVVGAIAVVTLSSLKNTQYSKNQIQATQFAQQNMEVVRSIRNSNYGICLESDLALTPRTCSAWQDIWNVNFDTPTYPSACSSPPCNFKIMVPCTVRTGATTTEQKPFCLAYSPTLTVTVLSRFTAEIIISDEAAGQKKVTSKVYWDDAGGQHSSNLVSILSKY